MKDIKKHQKQLQLKAKKDAEKAKQRKEEPVSESFTNSKAKPGNVSLAKQMMDLFTPKPIDFDPADNEIGHFSTKKGFLKEQDELLEDDEDAFGENTASKGDSLQSAPESKLRLRGDIALFDGKYAGVKTSRKQLDDDDDDDDDDEDEEDDEQDIDDDDDDEDVNDESSDNEDDEEDDGGDEEDKSDDESGDGWNGSDDDSQESNDNHVAEDDADEGFSTFMNSNNEALQLIEKELEEEEKKAVDTFQKGASKDVEKASHVRNQMVLWDQFIDIRIRLQKAIVLANRFPQNEAHASFLTNPADERLVQLSDAAIQQTGVLIDSLLECKQAMCDSNEQVPKLNRKRALETPSQDIESHWDDISAADSTFEGFMKDSIDRWNRKTQLFTGDLTGKKLKSMNQSILKQVEHVLGDEERLKKRTQLKRSSYRVIGEPEKSAADEKDEAEYNEEIFDDTDFYSQILKELIERKTGADSSDPISLSRQYLAMMQAKGKSRKKVDQRASKGRKIRFTVHEKLVSFMAPLNKEYPPVLDDLCSNLFGRNS